MTRLAHSALALAALALAGCGGADCPTGTVLVEGRCLEADARVAGMDAGPRPDAAGDAPGLDAWGHYTCTFPRGSIPQECN